MPYAELAYFTSNACAHCAAFDEANRLAYKRKQAFVAIERRTGSRR